MRLDLFIQQKFDLKSRTNASNLIKKGAVLVDGKTVLKTAFDVSGEEKIEIFDQNFASLGGYKLKKALSVFNILVKNKIAADIGASNGGFTDCLLRNGAKKVFAVDVAECQLLDSLIADERVVVADKLNARNLTVNDLGELVDIATIDVSFISLTYVLEAVKGILKDGGVIIALIKPQFEQEKKLNKSGIVSDAADRAAAVNKIFDFAVSIGLYPQAICCVPKLFENKNIEYPVLLTLNPEKYLPKHTKETINNLP